MQVTSRPAAHAAPRPIAHRRTAFSTPRHSSGPSVSAAARQDRWQIGAVTGSANASEHLMQSRRAVLFSLLGSSLLLVCDGRARADDAVAPSKPGPAEQPTTPPPSAGSSTAAPSGTPSAPGTPSTGSPAPGLTPIPLDEVQLTDAAVNKLLQEEEEKRKARRRKKGRIRELEEIRSELAEKELILLQKEQELLAKEESVIVLKEQLELERKLRALLSKEKEKAEEEAALAMGLCTGGAMLP